MMTSKKNDDRRVRKGALGYVAAASKSKGLFLLTRAFLIACVFLRLYRTLSWFQANFALPPAAPPPSLRDAVRSAHPPGLPLPGGVLPVRRFAAAGGDLLLRLACDACDLATNDGLLRGVRAGDAAVASPRACHAACCSVEACDGWHLEEGRTCSLYADAWGKMSAVPHPDASSVVGFMQRRAGLLRPPGSAAVSSRERVLYIVHFHHKPNADSRDYVLETMLTTCLPPFMDVVVITPHALLLRETDGDEVRTLSNPFVNSGFNSHLTLPVVMAKFPDYRGYLVVNDDAAVRFWKLLAGNFTAGADRWFGERPWGTFPPRGRCRPDLSLSECRSFSPADLPAQPWLPPPDLMTLGGAPPLLYKLRYDWVWFNFNPGRRRFDWNAPDQTNFDAAVEAMGDVCAEEEMRGWIAERGFARDPCDLAREGGRTLMPYVHGKADAFYVPGTELGRRMARLMTVLGERNVYLEIAVAMAYYLLVPDELAEEMPLCDFSTNTRRTLQGANGWTTENCVVLHAMKFSFEGRRDFWNTEMRENCAEVKTAKGPLQIIKSTSMSVKDSAENTA